MKLGVVNFGKIKDKLEGDFRMVTPGWDDAASVNYKNTTGALIVQIRPQSIRSPAARTNLTRALLTSSAV